MIGRWARAITAFKLTEMQKEHPAIRGSPGRFGVIIGVNSIAQYDMKPLYYYIVCVLVQDRCVLRQ
ncbi:MAG: hypothetical protein IPI66_15480 [Chitinophagaceae bacterium]|nr:hypothetical protein [Chitinophagaceae bacterium]